MNNCYAFLLIFFLIAGYQATAQLSYTATNNGGLLNFTDINGKSLVNEKYDPAIEGSPFLYKDWTDADLLTINGTEVKNVKVKLNIESNELYYLDSANTAWIAKEGSVKKISFNKLNSTEKASVIFKLGYPAIEKQSQHFYYQVLTEGKIELLKNNYKTIESSKNELSGEKKKEFVERTDYYIFSQNRISLFKNDKAFLLELMNDKKDKIEEYLLANKTNFKKIIDLQKLLGYYNGLN